MIRLFAHAAELHTESTTELEHTATNGWLPVALFVAGTIGVFLLLDRALKLRKDQSLIILLLLSLATTVAAWRAAPAVSMVSITLGFALALLFTLTALSNKA